MHGECVPAQALACGAGGRVSSRSPIHPGRTRNARSVTIPDAAPSRRFARYAWGVLALNVAVVLWGAYVRASGSGAGCGRHWPRCDGQVLPRMQSAQMVVEFTHRLSSGLALISVLGLLVWAWRAHPRGSAVRTGAVLSTGFIILEALVGAGLVLLALVAGDKSVARVWWMAAHLVNTFLLLGSITLTAWWASGGARVRIRGQGTVAWVMLAAVLATILVGVTGGVTALGDTLFPKDHVSLRVASAAHFLERLRIVHPAVAVLTALYVALAGYAARRLRPDARTTRLSRLLVALFAAQVLAGTVNVVLLAPIPMQIVHLLLADVVWITLVCTTASALADIPAPATPAAPEPRREPAVAAA